VERSEPAPEGHRTHFPDLALVLAVHLGGLLVVNALLAMHPSELIGLLANAWTLGAYAVVLWLTWRRVKSPSLRPAALVASGLLLTSLVARVVLVAIPLLFPS